MRSHRLLGGSLGTLAFSLVAVIGFAPGCEESGETGDEQNVVPEHAETPWDLAGLCSQNMERHSAVRAQELAEGIVRWQCGDRDGVDGEMGTREGRGQEYCEYHAISKGKSVRSWADVDADSPLFCYFTSIYLDVTGDEALDKKIAAELSKKENFNAPFDVRNVRMDGEFNARDAATKLVADSVAVEEDTDEQRQAACFLAAKKSPKNSEKLKKLCRGIDLSKKANWDKVTKEGVKIPKAGDAQFEAYKDMTACMSVGRLSNGGQDWRMSDPHITQVVVRANEECGCTYSALPDALHGFPQGTWSSQTKLPPGCRRAKVEGKDYELVTICEVSASDRSDIEVNPDYSENLQAFCNDKFGVDIVLTAPLRAVEKAGSCKKKDGDFCSEFTKTAK